MNELIGKRGSEDYRENANRNSWELVYRCPASGIIIQISFHYIFHYNTQNQKSS